MEMEMKKAILSTEVIFVASLKRYRDRPRHHYFISYRISYNSRCPALLGVILRPDIDGKVLAPDYSRKRHFEYIERTASQIRGGLPDPSAFSSNEAAALMANGASYSMLIDIEEDPDLQEILKSQFDFQKRVGHIWLERLEEIPPIGSKEFWLLVSAGSNHILELFNTRELRHVYVTLHRLAKDDLGGEASAMLLEYTEFSRDRLQGWFKEQGYGVPSDPTQETKPVIQPEAKTRKAKPQTGKQYPHLKHHKTKVVPGLVRELLRKKALMESDVYPPGGPGSVEEENHLRVYFQQEVWKDAEYKALKKNHGLELDSREIDGRQCFVIEEKTPTPSEPDQSML